MKKAAQLVMFVIMLISIGYCMMLSIDIAAYAGANAAAADGQKPYMNGQKQDSAIAVSVQTDTHQQRIQKTEAARDNIERIRNGEKMYLVQGSGMKWYDKAALYSIDFFYHVLQGSLADLQ